MDDKKRHNMKMTDDLTDVRETVSVKETFTIEIEIPKHNLLLFSIKQ